MPDNHHFGKPFIIYLTCANNFQLGSPNNTIDNDNNFGLYGKCKGTGTERRE